MHNISALYVILVSLQKFVVGDDKMSAWIVKQEDFYCKFTLRFDISRQGKPLASFS